MRQVQVERVSESPLMDRGGGRIEGLGRAARLADFNLSRLDQFWRFVAERQRIWHARFVSRAPPPWTSDPILRDNRFTNVYRELDPGTQYAVQNIMEYAAPKPDRVFNVMIYRLIGRSETHRDLGFQYLNEFDASQMEDCLKAIRAKGHPPFTAAYMVSGYRSMGSTDKVVNVCRLFALLANEFPKFFAKLTGSSDLEGAYSVIMAVDGFGNFLAYQILVDLTYPLASENGAAILPFSADEWSAPGPGARRGIALLVRDRTVSELAAMQWLHSHQKGEFSRLSVPFDYLRKDDGRPVDISLANIQNCLCEFYKYVKIREGTGRARRRFAASPAGASAKDWSRSSPPGA